MMVVSMADFSENVERYVNEASKSGLKIVKNGEPFLTILPEKKKKKLISKSELLSLLKPSKKQLWEKDGQAYVNEVRSEREN